MSEPRPTDIPFYALRLEHLEAEGAKLIATCTACQRTVEADVRLLIKKVGPEQRVLETERILRCSGCARRGWTMVRVEWP
jgi:uncharacterized protein with PIN domain